MHAILHDLPAEWIALCLRQSARRHGDTAAVSLFDIELAQSMKDP